MKIIILAREHRNTKLIYDTVTSIYSVDSVILEQSVNRKEFFKKRIKRLGLIQVVGQILFRILCVPFLKIEAKKRIEMIEQIEGKGDKEIPEKVKKRVASVNDLETIAFLKKRQPDVIIVSGTRIISEQVLQCTQAKFINIHSGITPQYRGAHGGYWALFNKDSIHCGVTLHYLDKGIDTGNVIAQKPIHITKQDNFITYPYLQIAAGLPLLKSYLLGEKNSKIESSHLKKITGKVYYHPTLITYIYGRLVRKVK